ncbi:MAG TPA: M23 family metallopeptidase [Stellaceae bacterium]|nr:M23 family metallopeptidase [Stellaceae bacterium]
MRQDFLARRGRRAAAAALALSMPLFACARIGPPAPVVVGQAPAPEEVALAPAGAAAPAEITVRRGQSLYGVARAYHVSPGALIAANHLHPPYHVEAGWTLVVPQRGMPAPPAAPAAVAALPPSRPMPQMAALHRPPPPMPRPMPARAAAPAPAAPPAALLPPEKPDLAAAPPARPPLKTAAAPPPQMAALAVPKPAAAPSPGGFLWPLRGHILAGYGTGPDGTHNDGINIGAPRGAPVQATAPGVVVYAGNELRGYGNLILVKHAGGWISAYAHCDVILVKRGQHVGRGQIIARVGSTGNVGPPQLHFELRRGDKPVDPRTLLAPLSTAERRADNPSG